MAMLMSGLLWPLLWIWSAYWAIKGAYDIIMWRDRNGHWPWQKPPHQ